MSLLGKKPLADMTEEELEQVIEELRAEREALRAEGIKEKNEKKEKEVTTAARTRETTKKNALGAAQADILAAMMKEDK